MSAIALYTAVYPAAAPFLDAWHASVQAQTDRDFDLWISVDGLTETAVAAQLGNRPAATFVVAEPGSTPAQVRQQALTRIADEYEAVVLVDSDDLLHPDRVAAARAWLAGADVTACGLRLVDEAGQPVGLSLATPDEDATDSVLPRTNAFGLSNTAYRSDLLRACLPIPAAAALVDWYLITMAWLQGARLAFDPTPRMDYRQHGANMARMRPPFTAERVRADTVLVREHFRLVLDRLPVRSLPARATQVREAAADVAAFDQFVIEDAARLSRYVRKLNAAPPPLLWWASVAYPPLRSSWTTNKEPA
jgi:glycosyltransferase involved in cell wall biosynthesis